MCVYICIYIYLSLCICIYIYIYLYVYMYMYIYIGYLAFLEGLATIYVYITYNLLYQDMNSICNYPSLWCIVGVHFGPLGWISSPDLWRRLLAWFMAGLSIEQKPLKFTPKYQYSSHIYIYIYIYPYYTHYLDISTCGK